MSTTPTRVFVARLLGLDVFDPLGDRLGRLRDVVVLSRGAQGAPHVVGIVVEVPGKKRVFVPMTRITSIDQTQIIFGVTRHIEATSKVREIPDDPDELRLGSL